MSDDVLAPLDAALRTAGSARPESDLRAFLIADIRGYTSFTQRAGDERAATLAARFAAATRAVVEAFEGTVLELRGDEALCVFASPRQALRAAVALQRRFVEETRAEPELPLPVGIGLDIGEAVPVEGGYRGGALNLAARLCALAGPGEILATPEVTHLARRLDGLTYVPRDAVRIKGLDDPVRPVRVVPEGEDPARQLAALRPRPPARPPPGGPHWLPAPLRRRPWLAVGALLVAAAVVAGTFVVVTGGSSGLTSLAENVAGIADPGSGTLVGQVPVGTNPTAIAAGAGYVWAVNTDDDTLARIDPRTRTVQDIGVGDAPTSVAVGGGAVWVANSSSGTVSRIDPRTGRVQQVLRVGATPSAVAFYRGALWVTDTAAAVLLRLDPPTGAVTRVPVGDSPSAVVAGGGQLWVSNSGDGTVSAIEPSQATALPPVHVGNDPRGLALDGKDLWVANNLDGTVTRLDTATSAVVSVIRAGGGPVGVAVAAGNVWVADQDGAAITEIDPARNIPISTIGTGSQLAGVVAAGGQLWITAGARPAMHRGGTLTAVLAGTEIDPSYLDAPVQRMLYDGLVGLRQAPGAAFNVAVPDLAASLPPPGDGGRSYTFRLRRGVRWSSGAPVTADDIRRGIERAVVAGAIPDLPILGADACTPTACDLSAGVAADAAAGTVTIRLRKPTPEFFPQLSYAVAVPASTPLAKVHRPLPTTGPYEVAEFNPEASLLLVRNPHFREWSHAAQPAGFPDRLAFTVDPAWGDHPQDVSASRYDWLDVRGADLTEVRARFGDRLKTSPQLNVRYTFLNTSVPPFDSLDARRAVSFAIDRAAVAADWPIPGEVTCQVLPPTVPGYRPYCPYTLRAGPSGAWNAPDLVMAQNLVRRSGTAGAAVTVWTDEFVRRGMQAVVDAMNAIGYRATLHVVSTNSYFDVVSRHPEAQAGFVGWIGDYPSPSEFTYVSTCPAIARGKNLARFCDPAIDARNADALALEAQSPQRAGDTWAEVDRALTDAAPLVPMLVTTNAALLSARVRHYEVDPTGPLYDQLWLK
jgi:YVTN family beta-propeller protein